MHTCATRTDSTLWCWGLNDSGSSASATPPARTCRSRSPPPPPTGWASVTAGAYHTCAARTDTTLWCWGGNYFGQLGIGNQQDQDLPQQVTTPATDGWASVTAGDFHTCATRTHAAVVLGRQRRRASSASAAEPTRPGRARSPPAPTGWSRLATGGIHTCATHTGHTLWCWGSNREGELGIGTTVDQDLPQQVTS